MKRGEGFWRLLMVVSVTWKVCGLGMLVQILEQGMT